MTITLWIYKIILPYVLVILLFSTTIKAETINFDGTLVEDACEVYPGDENIELDFGAVVDKYLYLNTRTDSQPFTIRLINCNLTLGREVTVMFNGAENIALPGLLAIDPSSQASGIAIGLELANGIALPINSGKYKQSLHTGNVNNLSFNAYIQAEPSALLTKKIRKGEFIASSTFTLQYE